MTTQNTDKIIDVAHLSKAFGTLKAVNDVKLTVAKGEIFGFLGPNGSGKTTTIRMLCGLLIPDTAEGTCLHYDILTKTQEIKRHVGYMTQRFSLYEELSVLENLRFVAGIYGIKNKSQAIERVINHFDFADKTNQLAGTLSGGWKQRLALASAILHEPQLLLLDEPTAGVDPKARRDFWAELYRLSRAGVTTLVSTHYMDEVERCSRLAYISKGRVLMNDTPQNIIDNSPLTTWTVSGNNLIDFAEKLQSLPGIDLIIPYGRLLHVCGEDATLLQTTIQSVQTAEHTWMKIKPSLEDIFIKLIGDRKSK